LRGRWLGTRVRDVMISKGHLDRSEDGMRHLTPICIAALTRVPGRQASSCTITLTQKRDINVADAVERRR